MKKFFILASAAIVALASCAKTEVVYKDAPEEIAFKQITNVMTKTDALSGSMGVFAYYNESSYFDKTEFAVQPDETYWTAATPKYWPLSGVVDFVMYAPYSATANSSSATNLTFTRTAGETSDLVYGKVSSAKTANAVEVTLDHALTMIQVKVKGSADVKLKKVELLKIGNAGTGTVTFGTPNSVAWNVTGTLNEATIWTPTSPATEQALNGSTAIESAEYLVVPTSALNLEQIKLTYTITGGKGDLTYTTTAGTGTNVLGTAWASGNKYIYDITISATEIMFDSKVATWTEPGTTPL